jgi:hypothetical protein
MVFYFHFGSCAEQAISALNGAKIGRQCVRVSWGPRPSKLNKEVSHIISSAASKDVERV